MRTPIFAANWKLHLGPRDAAAFMHAFLSGYAPHEDRTVLVFPPALSLSTVADVVREEERTDILPGVQNIHWETKGAFTGESSAPLARQAGARCALVGHSERRHLFGETDEETARKCVAAFDAELVPVLCVGETIEERARGESAAVVLRQLRAGIERLTPEQIGAMVVAYEPVWAIGTGRTATPADAAEMHATIREALGAYTGGDAGGIPILYGGSVNETNARSLLEASDVDGLLVGGASLEVERWTRVVCSLDRDPQRA